MCGLVYRLEFMTLFSICSNKGSMIAQVALPPVNYCITGCLKTQFGWYLFLNSWAHYLVLD